MEIQKLNKTLDKKVLIDNVYEKIIEKEKINTENITEAHAQVRAYIDNFMEEENCTCTICGKPNWEKLANDLGLNYQEEFWGNKCGYCKQIQPKIEFVYSPIRGVWMKK